jgi:hypothetical protein
VILSGSPTLIRLSVKSVILRDLPDRRLKFVTFWKFISDWNRRAVGSSIVIADKRRCQSTQNDKLESKVGIRITSNKCVLELLDAGFHGQAGRNVLWLSQVLLKS